MDFADQTGAAGINQIAYSTNQIIRIFWIIIWVILAGVGFYEAYSVIQQFFSYPMIVTTSSNYCPQDFPVITFFLKDTVKINIFLDSPYKKTFKKYFLTSRNTGRSIGS